MRTKPQPKTAGTATRNASAQIRAMGYSGADARALTGALAIRILGGRIHQEREAAHLAQAWSAQAAVEFVILKSVLLALGVSVSFR